MQSLNIHSNLFNNNNNIGLSWVTKSYNLTKFEIYFNFFLQPNSIQNKTKSNLTPLQLGLVNSCWSNYLVFLTFLLNVEKLVSIL